MAELTEFKTPNFLETATEEYYTDLALGLAPPEIDTSEGQMYFDHTKPTAIIASEITQFHIPIALQMMFPQFATGEYLELHGQPYGMFRRSPTKATGLVEIRSAKEGSIIPAGLTLYTLGDEVEDAKEYITTKEVVIEGGVAHVNIEAIESGVIGNTAARSVVAAQRGHEIDSASNPEAVTGGTEAESDESLRERILTRIGLAPLSGARRDYERWAKEVDGVGGVIVQPLWRGPQTVRVLITDSNNEVANEELIKKVKDYIDPEENEGVGEGQAPIGAIVTIDTIELVPLDIEASFTFEDEADPYLTIERVKESVDKYLLESPIIRLSEVGAAIVETSGVLDYQDLTLNGQYENIEMPESQRAVVGEVVNSGS